MRVPPRAGELISFSKVMHFTLTSPPSIHTSFVGIVRCEAGSQKAESKTPLSMSQVLLTLEAGDTGRTPLLANILQFAPGVTSSVRLPPPPLQAQV